jgi:hypothetical protein
MVAYWHACGKRMGEGNFQAQKGGCLNDFLEGVVLDNGWYDL